MSKKDLVTAISKSAGLTREQASNAVDAFVSTVSDTLAAGGSVELKGFGSFSTSQRAARTGRNPQTGAPLDIAAKSVPKFKAGRTLKAACN